MSNKIYTCLHCGTQFVNLDGMLRCKHCGGRLAVMVDEELAPVGTGPSTERKALDTQLGKLITDEARRLNDRRDVIAHAHNLSLEEHKRDRSSETALEHHRRIQEARIHNRNLLEAQRKQKAEGKEAFKSLNAFNRLYIPRPQPRRTIWKQLAVLMLVWGIIVLGFFSTMGDYSMEDAPAIYVEVEVRIGNQIPFCNTEAPVWSYDVLLFFANGTYAETIQTDDDGLGHSSIAYPMFTEFTARNWADYNIGQFVVLPNNGEDCCRVVLYLFH